MGMVYVSTAVHETLLCGVQVLQDRNDELSLELELLKNRRSRRPAGDASALSWKQQHAESGNRTQQAH